MWSFMTSVLKRSACSRMRSISFGPVRPCGSPGQLSTSVVVSELAAFLETGQQQRLAIGARGIDGGGIGQRGPTPE